MAWSQFCLFLYLMYDLLTKRKSLLMHVRPCTCSLCVDLNIFHINKTVHHWQEGINNADVSVIKKDLKSELFWKHSDVSVVWDTLFYFLIIHLKTLKPLKRVLLYSITFMLFSESVLQEYYNFCFHFILSVLYLTLFGTRKWWIGY